MKSSLEVLEGNKVKLVVEVDESEFEKDIDAAFKRLAREVRLPGFRPGKAPRQVLEARIGSEYARQEAFRDGLPNYYVEAVKEHEVDVIAPPQIDITDGEEAGDVSFDAVVEIRPSVEVGGYADLEVEIPSPFVPDDAIDEQIERMLGQFGTLEEVDRAAEEGDRVTIDIAVTHEGEPVAGLTADDYLYQIGLGAVVPELDEQLTGASAGDELSFSADHPDDEEDEPLEFEVAVKSVQATVLPEPDDDWAKEASEFDTLEELRDDVRERLGQSRLMQAVSARRNAVAEKLAELVDDENVPEALVEMELENRAQDMAMRLQAQGIEFEQFLQMTGQSREDAIEAMREQAATAAKLDLALRAIGEGEEIDVTDADLDEEFGRVAEQLERSTDDVRAEFTTAGQLPAVRSDLLKSKALDWVIDHTAVIDQDGSPIAAADLEVPDEESPVAESPAANTTPIDGVAEQEDPEDPADGDDSADATDDEGDEA